MAPVIIVDAYEPKHIKKRLQELGAKVIIKDIRGKGDYIVPLGDLEIRIERKRYRDFFTSLYRNEYENGNPKPNGRSRQLFTQLMNLIDENTIPILLIEGNLPYKQKERNIMYGVFCWAIRKGITIVPTKNWIDTAYFIYKLAKKYVER